MADEAKKFNLDEFDDSLVQETVEIDTDANPMEAPPPVSDGVHRFKLVVNSDSFELLTTKPNKSGETQEFIKCSFYGVCQDEGGPDNNKRVFGRVNTLTFNGKNEMAYILLQIYGGKDNPEAVKYVKSLTKYPQIAKAFKTALAGEPIIKIRTKWVASVNKGTKSEPDYQTVKSGQASFPEKSKGVYSHVLDTEFGEVTARAEIQDYYPDK